MGGKDSQQWKNREVDWYNAERRFIFSAASKAEMNTWLKYFSNQIVQKPVKRLRK